MDSQQKLWNVSVQQVQIFLKAVELKNFTQVANHFNFTPSMVSKTISSLENELDIRLFTRKPRELTPTPAAILLASEWRQFVRAFSNSIEKARSYQDNLPKKIVFGFVDSSADVDQMIRQSILQYMHMHPQIDITAEKHDMHRLVELLNHGFLDVIQTSSMESAYLDEHCLPWEKVFDSSAAVFVPEGNDLFKQDSLDLDQLKNQKFLTLDPVMHPSYTSWLHSLCQKLGFVPDITATYKTVRSLLFSLKMRNDIFIGDTITSDWCDEQLKCFVLPEKLFSLIAWRNNSEKEIVEFKEYLKERYPRQY